MINNPLVPGDPGCYDLKWIVARIKEILAQLGTLDEAIEAKIFEGFLEHSIVQFKTVPEMLAADITDGSIVLTLGYHEAGDQGGLFYLVKDFNPSQCSLNYFLTMDNNAQIAIPIFTEEYVTPQMYGAKADDTTDAADFIELALENGKNVYLPEGKYYCSRPVEIKQEGTVLYGSGVEDRNSVIRVEGTNAITIASGYRGIIVKDLYMITNSYQGAAIEISKTSDSPDGSVHFLTVENIIAFNFKYGLLLGGHSTGSADGSTYFWNCSFKNIKLNTHDTGTNCAIKIFHNVATNFGLYFERVITIGYKTVLEGNAINAIFESCNFGINATNAIVIGTSSSVAFRGTNFECDSYVTGTQYAVLVSSTYISIFENCSFISRTDANTAFFGGGTLSKFSFKGCQKRSATGDNMTLFFSSAFSGKKYSIEYLGGNHDLPRPTIGKTRSLQILDIENSVLPKQYAVSENDTPQMAEQQYDVEQYTGKRPVWYNGADWKGGTLGTWKYYEDIAAGASFTETLPIDTDKPRTLLVCFRGHVNTSYYIGIVSQYRGGAGITLIPLGSNDITVTNAKNVLTVTNAASSFRYMYGSFIELI